MSNFNKFSLQAILFIMRKVTYIAIVCNSSIVKNKFQKLLMKLILFDPRGAITYARHRVSWIFLIWKAGRKHARYSRERSRLSANRKLGGPEDRDTGTLRNVVYHETTRMSIYEHRVYRLRVCTCKTRRYTRAIFTRDMTVATLEEKLRTRISGSQ